MKRQFITVNPKIKERYKWLKYAIYTLIFSFIKVLITLINGNLNTINDSFTLSIGNIAPNSTVADMTYDLVTPFDNPTKTITGIYGYVLYKSHGGYIPSVTLTRAEIYSINGYVKFATTVSNNSSSNANDIILRVRYGYRILPQ